MWVLSKREFFMLKMLKILEKKLFTMNNFIQSG